MNIKKILAGLGVVVLVGLATVGWIVLFVQKPDILARARVRYIQAVNSQANLENGPCLGKIADDWVLDIAHLPRQEIDDQPENQCPDYRFGKVHHFVEMTPKGEVITVH